MEPKSIWTPKRRIKNKPNIRFHLDIGGILITCTYGNSKNILRGRYGRKTL